MIEAQDYRRLTQPQRRELRLRYVEDQDQNCHYCKAPLNGAPPKSILRKPVRRTLFPPTFFDHPIHLHHDHKTGMTIGAVHARCNAVLWQYHGE